MKTSTLLAGPLYLATLTACNAPPPEAGAFGHVPHAVGSAQSPDFTPPPAPLHKTALGLDAPLAQNAQESSASGAAEAEARREAISSLPGSDISFIQRIGNDGQSEEQAALYVASKTRNNAVRNYAARIGQDHGKANQQLRTLAARRNIEIPSDPVGQLRVKLDRLRQLSGAQMDAYFLTEFAVLAHMDTIALFEVQEQQTSDRELREFTARQLPKLRKHYEQGKALQGAYSAPEEKVTI